MGNNTREFRLDRSIFRMGKAEDSWLQETGGKTLSWQERLRNAHYLISTAYSLPLDKWPPMDKSYFRIKRR